MVWLGRSAEMATKRPIQIYSSHLLIVLFKTCPAEMPSSGGSSKPLTRALARASVQDTEAEVYTPDELEYIGERTLEETSPIPKAKVKGKGRGIGPKKSESVLKSVETVEKPKDKGKQRAIMSGGLGGAPPGELLTIVKGMLNQKANAVAATPPNIIPPYLPEILNPSYYVISIMCHA